MAKKLKYEFDQQSATRNLRTPEVVFSISNPRLDDIFNMEFGPVDYVEKDDALYYKLSPIEFDRFLDFLMSSGFDPHKDIQQVDDIHEMSTSSGAGAYNPSLHATKKKRNPFIKENLDFYKIEVAVSDARKAIDIIQNDRIFSRKTRIYSSNVFILQDPEVAMELFNTFEEAGVQMISYMIPSEMPQLYESILGGYKELTGFRPGHTPDKGGFQYKDLWNVNEVDLDKEQFLDKLKNIDKLDPKEKVQILSRVHSLPKGAIKPSFKKERNGYSVKYINPESGAITTGFLSQARIDNFLNGTIKLKKNNVNELESNDPVLMKMRAQKDAPKPQVQKPNPNQSKINMLLKKRAEIMRDMEQEAEPEGGPIADYYGDMLNKIDSALNKFTSLNENYSQFRNSTKTRSGSEQYHQAVKLVKKKVQEISKLHSYMERMQQELSETQEGLKKKKYTQMAIDKIKAEIKELNKKVRKLK